MAYSRKKKTSYKGTWRRKSLARVVAGKAPRKFNWVPVLDTICAPIVLPARVCHGSAEDPEVSSQTFDVDCETGVIDLTPAEPVHIVIVPPADPYDAAGALIPGAAYLNDEVRVRRLTGYVRLIPFYVYTAAAVDYINNAGSLASQTIASGTFIASRNYLLRAGLKKDQWLWDDLTASYSAPVRDPMRTQEWTDGQFARTWTKQKMLGELGNTTVTIPTLPGGQIGCCGNTTGTISGGGGGTTGVGDNILVDGSGTINVDIDPVTGTIETDCEPCLMGENVPAGFAIQFAREPSFVLPLNSGRSFTLKENEGLSMWLQYHMPPRPLDTACIVDPPIVGEGDERGLFMAVGFLASVHVKALIET